MPLNDVDMIGFVVHCCDTTVPWHAFTSHCYIRSAADSSVLRLQRYTVFARQNVLALGIDRGAFVPCVVWCLWVSIPSLFFLDATIVKLLIRAPRSCDYRIIQAVGVMAADERALPPSQSILYTYVSMLLFWSHHY